MIRRKEYQWMEKPDFRRSKCRRRGELHGRFCWRSLMAFLAVMMAIAATDYVSFELGRYYERVNREPSQITSPAIWKEWKAARVKGH